MELAAWRLLVWWVAHVAGLRGRPVELVVVGAGPAGRALAAALSSSGATTNIVAFVDPDLSLVGGHVGGAPVLALTRLPEIIRSRNRPPRVVLAITDEVHGEVYDQLTALAEAGIEVVPMVSVYEEATGRVPVWNLGNLWWAVLPRPSSDLLYIVLKRAVDLLGAFLGLVLLGVLLPVLALLLRRETRGSLFFSQKRVGVNGQSFVVHKLRTLAVQRQAFESHWERKRSNRASRVGSLLRATGIDELPQCLNVLMGDMSLVGPRPYVPEEVADFQARIPFFRGRSLVRPGITGWAQVNRGYGLSLDDEVEKLQYDLYYVGHQSLFLDLLVIVKTLSRLLHVRRRLTDAGSAAAVQPDTGHGLEVISRTERPAA
jgi:lipopolysaccharide/colanic/teichoic acid biosynthesis glycosyltransferase